MRKFILSYLLVIFVISSIHFLLIYKTLSQSEKNYLHQTSAQLNFDTEFLTLQTEKNLENIISDIKSIPISKRDTELNYETVKKLLKRRKVIFHLNYFSADGNLIYSSKKAALEWQSNLLNAGWYRTLIREWKIVISNVHKSPVSPFPNVIALAVPVSNDNRIDGFWLAYLDLAYANDLFMSLSSKKIGTTTIWFDGNGELLNIGSNNPEMNNHYIKSNGWWYKINESNSADTLSYGNVLTDYKANKKYLYSTRLSNFENIQVLVVQDYDKALASYYSFRSANLLVAIILQLIIMIITAIILWQSQKKRLQLTELINVNNLLEVKSNALIETNKKLDKLVYELDEQKKQLINTKNTLERVQKYLNFLTLPVVALDENLTYEFVNRAAEIEFKYSDEKLLKKPFNKFLQIKDESNFYDILNNAKKSLKRQETNISIQINKSNKNYMVACDYLVMSDWQGFIITFNDLTDLLDLQNSIKIQNIFLEKTSFLTELFLQQETEEEILTKALQTLKIYSNANELFYYQNEEGKLILKACTSAKQKLFANELPREGIAAGAIISGEPVLIKNKDNLPDHVHTYEKDLILKKAIFQPLIINNKSVGVVVIKDPGEDIFDDYDNTLLKLMMHFKIGLSALMSKTKLEIANEDLKKSAALRAQLLRSITHGLKTPLSTIKGYVKLIQLKFLSLIKQQPELYKYIQKLDLATEDMDDKIKMYLDMARINRNDLNLEYKQVQALELIDSLYQQLLLEAKTKSININYLNDGLSNRHLTIDPARFGFVLKTIFINAMKYAPEQDNVILNASIVQNFLKVSFEEHGKPIKKEYIPLIGSEFLPAEVLNERMHYGDSMAMALAVKIIQLAGGELKIDSDKNKTVHVINLPISANVKV